MRLTWVHRVGLLILGAAALGGAVTLSIMDVGSAAGAAGVIALILPGFLVITFAIVGVFPNVHIKEGNIDWPKVDETRSDPGQTTAGELAQLRQRLGELNARLEDYILA